MSLKRILAINIFVLILSNSIFNNASAQDSQETIGVTATEIKIGSVYPQTGALRNFHLSFFAGANAYFDYLNKNAGIYGRKVYLIAGDDQGLPTRSITATNDLILQSGVFALFNSSPTTPSHMAMYNVLRNRNIPDFYPTSSYSGFRNTVKYPNLIAMGTSSQQEARVAAVFSKDYFPEKSFVWRNNLLEGDVESDVRNAWSNMGFTVKPNYADENTGTISITNILSTVENGKKPLILSGRAVSTISRGVVFDPKTLADTYAINILPLVSDRSNEFVSFFEGLNLKYSNGAPFDAAFLEGSNSAYVFAQALAATGPNPTRSGLIKAFRAFGNSFSSATYGNLDFGSGVSAGKATFSIAKFDGSSWSSVGNFYTNELDSNLVIKGPVQSTKLLPNGLPKMSLSLSKVSITCTKGKISKVVKDVNPKCPTGYKKK